MIGQDEDSTIDISVPGAHSDYITLAGGFQYEIGKDVLLNFGMSYTGFASTYENRDQYDSFMSPDAKKKYNKQYLVMAIGANYRF